MQDNEAGTIYLNPGNSKRMKTMHAFVSEDANGNHRILASGAFPGMPNYPLVTMDERLLPKMREVAKKTARETGVKIMEVTFRVESMKEIRP